MSNIDEKFEDLKEDTKFKIIQLEDEFNDDKKKKILDDLSAQIEKIFDKAKVIAEETKDNDKVQSVYAKAKEDANIAFQKAKQTLNDFKNDEKVKDLFDSIVDGVNNIIDSINENEKIKEVSDKVNVKIDEVLSNEKVQEGISVAKDVTVKAADKIHDSITSILKDKNGD